MTMTKEVECLSARRTIESSSCIEALRKATIEARQCLGTLAVAGVASLSILALRMSGSSVRWMVLCEHLVAIGIACLLFLMARRRTLDGKQNYGLTLGLAVVLMLLPYGSSLLQRKWFGLIGEAHELIWLALFQNLSLVLASQAFGRKERWLSFLASTFLVIFGIVAADRSGVEWFLALYSIVAAWWLMIHYWLPLEGSFLPTATVRLYSMRFVSLAVLAVVSLPLVIVCRNQVSSRKLLIGLMPTSGGEASSDGVSRKGVGEGELLVGAMENATTFGPVESEVFLESNAPSLYDLVSEIYGEPIPKKRQHSRAVALDSSVLEANREGKESQKSVREFATHRVPKEGKTKDPAENDSSRAVIQLIGSSPLHLRLESFDAFDGGTWRRSEIGLPRGEFDTPRRITWGGKPWMQTQSLRSELVYPVREQLLAKIIQFQSQRVLSPSFLSHVHIDRIDQEDFFGWSSDGQLIMPNHEAIPRLTVLHQVYGIFQPHVLLDPSSPLSGLTFDRCREREQVGWLDPFLECGQHEKNYFEVASEWLRDESGTRGNPMTDWQKVRALVRRLRHRFEHDPKYLLPEDVDDTIVHTLASKRGTDYSIAGVAVMMIRSLGIPCRLVTGFYVDPKRYSVESGQSDVMPEDLHTWAEVYVHGMWVPIEPTGTYAEPREHRTWRQYAAECFWAVRNQVVASPVRTILSLIVTVTLCVIRKRLFIAGLGICMFVVLGFKPQARVRWLMRLLAWQSYYLGKSVPRHATVTHRLQMLEERADQVLPPGLSRVLMRTLHFVLYAPAEVCNEWIRRERLTIDRECRRLAWFGFCRWFA